MTQFASSSHTAHYPVWDRAVRLVHWYLPIAIAVMWWSGEQGRMDIHEKVGYSLLCLITTRVIWGFVGSEAARFRAFLVAPLTLLAYLKEGGQYAGHNPLGGLSVVVLLMLLLTQAGSGVFSRDDLLFEGPFFLLGRRSVRHSHRVAQNKLAAAAGFHSTASTCGVLVPVAKKAADRAGYVARSGGLQVCQWSTQAAVVGGAARHACVGSAVDPYYYRA